MVVEDEPVEVDLEYVDFDKVLDSTFSVSGDAHAVERFGEL